MTDVLPILGVLTAATAIFCGTILFGPKIVVASRSTQQRARRHLGLGALNPSASSAAILAYLVMPLIGAALGAYLFQHPVGMAGCAVLAVLATRVYVLRIIARREELMEQQLPSAIDQLVALIRGQLTLAKAMQELGASTPEPVNAVFREIHRLDMLALPLDQAFEKVAEETASGNVRLVLSALAVFCRQGGNAIEPLQEMSAAFKEIVRLAEKIRTASSEARANFTTINGAALFMVGTIWLSQPQLLQVLATTAVGGVLLLVAAAFWLAGFYWMRQMVRIEV